MSIESVSKALQAAEVKGTVKLVLLGIANHDGDNGAFPSIATLARYAVCSTRRVQQCIAELEEVGLVTVEQNAGGLKDWREDRRPNRYRLHLDGVKPVAPRDDDGVKSGAERGEIQGTNGVKPTSPKPSSNHPLEPSSTSSSTPSFEVFWAAYPKKHDKGEARIAFMKLSSTDRIAALEGAWRHGDYIRGNPQTYILPNGAVWLHKRRWEDEEPKKPPVEKSSTHNGIATLNAIRQARLGS